MKIKVSQKMGRVPVTILHIEGRINLGTADNLRQEAQTIFEKGARDLLIDLSEVKSITSEGLRAIHSIYKLYLDKPSPETLNGERLRSEMEPEKASHFKLLNPSSDILRVLKISGFDEFIEIHHNFEDAIASF